MRSTSTRIARLAAIGTLTLTLGATAGAGPALAGPCTNPILCPTSTTLAAGEDANMTKIPGNLAVPIDTRAAGEDDIEGIAPVPEGGIAPVPEADAGATDKYTPASIDTLAAGEDASTNSSDDTSFSLADDDDASTDAMGGGGPFGN